MDGGDVVAVFIGLGFVIFLFYTIYSEKVDQKRPERKKEEDAAFNAVFDLFKTAQRYAEEAEIKQEQERARNIQFKAAEIVAARGEDPTPILRKATRQTPTPPTESDLPRDVGLGAAPASYTAPETARTEHTLIAASSGHGKTQLLQSLILDDIEKDATVIVIDSQRELIRNLLNVAPAHRLVHIDPTDLDRPLALNLFSQGQDPALYEYIFGALESQMTAKQSMAYRYLAQFVSIIPGGNIDTMRELLEGDGLVHYANYIDTLPHHAIGFFMNQYNTRDYNETKQQIARRIYALLENPYFRQMFTAPQMKLNVAREMNAGKVMLIDTAKRTLTGDAFKVFGRFFIAQISKAIFQRSHPFEKRVYLYIDEFQEYAGEEDFITELFTQARKFNVSITVAFQYIDQLPEKVRQAILSNTATKIVGGLSASDRRLMANEFGLTKEEAEELGIASLPKGHFLTKTRGGRVRSFKADFGRLERLGKRSSAELGAIKEATQEKYSQELHDIVAGAKERNVDVKAIYEDLFDSRAKRKPLGLKSTAGLKKKDPFEGFEDKS